jgi:hypothetical protein
MLNELYQAAVALGRRKVPSIELHQSLEPMGRAALLVVKLDDEAKPASVEVLRGEDAAKLFRVKHASSGVYFPGFNLPMPLRSLMPSATTGKIVRLVEAQRNRNSPASELALAAADLIPESESARFERSDVDQFRRSTRQLVEWLRVDLDAAPPKLANLRRLVAVVSKAKPELPKFAEDLAHTLLRASQELARLDWLLMVEILFGKTHLPRVKEEVGSTAYWRAKKVADDKLGKQPLYLDLACSDSEAWPVADWRTGRLLNGFLLEHDPPPYDPNARVVAKPVSKPKRPKQPAPQPADPPRDAYSGLECKLTDRFPEPKLAVLGNTKLFSNNAGEAGCFFRYGLGDANTFKVGTDTIHSLSAAAFTLAGDDFALPALGGMKASGRTCREIPPQRDGLRQLLVAYLEDKPDASDPWVELFGAQASDASSPDYGESTKPILAALDGEAVANPNELVRLIAIAQLDNANKQASLNRSFTVREVKRAVDAWQAGAANCPPVPLTFWSEQANRTVRKDRTIPGPLDVTSVLNRVWRTDMKGGYEADFHRAFSTSDAFDLFIGPEPLRRPKAAAALAILLVRMRPVFTRSATFKVSRDYHELDCLYKRQPLSEDARWQVLKAIALIGILLDQLGNQHKTFMKDSIYQVGRLLALADSLHFQYCKWVRTSDDKRKSGKVDAPSELLGNSLFNFALDNPVAALARLAERIRPYKGWADTYSGESAGLVHWFVRQLGECERQLDATGLPTRMEDIHKAQLLLGYLADHSKTETESK